MRHRDIPITDDDELDPDAGPQRDAAAGASPQPFGSGAESDPADAAGVERALSEASAEEATLRNQLLRLAAEFDNYRKRESRERLEAWGRAKADLIEKLLPAIDDLSRVAHPESAETPGSAVGGLLAGVELVERKLLQALEREGLVPIEVEGAAFDPALHEAVLTRPTGDPDLAGRVAHVVAPGYRFGDRLVRPAKVVVWKLEP